MGVKIKKHRDVFYALIISIIISFMLFFYEPITMYANNANDFWFDLYTIIKPMFICFLICFIILSVLLIVTYYLSKKFNKINIYYCSLIAIISLTVVAYIHSNYLSGFLPPLDGTTFDWNVPLPNIISIIICLAVIGITIICIKKLKIQKTITYYFYAMLAIFAILVFSLSVTILSTDALKQKSNITSATEENINLISNDNNFLILLVDAVDSTHFNNIVKSNPTYEKTFKDFTYYPDTLSGYAFTRDSIPFIFSGKWNENQTTFAEYSTEAYNNSEFFTELEKQNYSRNFYETGYTWNSEKVLDFDNIISIEKEATIFPFAREQMKYILFKTLPHPLKRFSHINTMNFELTKPEQSSNNFKWDDVNFYNNYLKQPLSKTDSKYFQFVHIEGGHTPFDVNRNVEHLPNEDGTYEEKLEATMKIISAYLERLKEYDSYDNSTIVILADHGFWHNGTTRANPILYIKGSSEKHSKMITSSKQISYVDLKDAFLELLSGKQSTELFSDFPIEGRTRRFLYNGFNEEEHMYEYEQKGKAWDADALRPTGKVFDL